MNKRGPMDVVDNHNARPELTHVQNPARIESPGQIIADGQEIAEQPAAAIDIRLGPDAARDIRD
jgi:hypothetical protein